MTTCDVIVEHEAVAHLAWDVHAWFASQLELGGIVSIVLIDVAEDVVYQPELLGVSLELGDLFALKGLVWKAFAKPGL
jgi:hypothetical protein